MDNLGKIEEGNQQEESGRNQSEVQGGLQVEGENSKPGPSKVHSVQNFNGGDGKSQNSKEGGIGDGACKKEVGSNRVQTKGVQTSVTESNPQRTILRYALQKMLGEV